MLLSQPLKRLISAVKFLKELETGKDTFNHLEYSQSSRFEEVHDGKSPGFYLSTMIEDMSVFS